MDDKFNIPDRNADKYKIWFSLLNNVQNNCEESEE